MYFEFLSIQKMKKEGMDNTYEVTPLTEEGKRARNYRHSIIISIFGLIAFIFFIGIGNDNLNGRKCANGQGIKNGVCLDCTDTNCKKCGSDAGVCEICYDSFYNVDGLCKRCDNYGLCSKCDSLGTCLECSSRNMVVDGACISCSRDKSCAKCDSD